MMAAPLSAKSRFVGEFTLLPSLVDTMARSAHQKPVLPSSGAYHAVSTGHDCALCWAGPLLTGEESRLLHEEVLGQRWVDVGLDGILAHYQVGDSIGSSRASAYSEALAELLWKRIQPLIPANRHFGLYASTDAPVNTVWRPVGVNSLMRFIRYRPGQYLVAHYDAPYVERESRQSLMSLVIYLTDPGPEEAGGATRFLWDAQDALPFAERDFSDWNRGAHFEELRHCFRPKAGGALLFDHRLLHDGERWKGDGHKIILRTDVIFERC